MVEKAHKPTDDSYLIARRKTFIKQEGEAFKTLLRRIVWASSVIEYYETNIGFYETKVEGSYKYVARRKRLECEAELRRYNTALKKYKEIKEEYLANIKSTFAHDDKTYRDYYINVVLYGRSREDTKNLMRLTIGDERRLHERLKKE